MGGLEYGGAAMGDAKGETMGRNSCTDAYWTIPLHKDCTFYVDSPASDNFLLMRFALENAAIIAMDAEWKPVGGGNGSASHPRVAILQIACRMRGKLQVETEEKSGNRSSFAVDVSARGGLSSKITSAHLKSRFGPGSRSLGGICSNEILRGSWRKGECNEDDSITTQAENRELVALLPKLSIFSNEKLEQRTHRDSTSSREGSGISTDFCTAGNETKASNELVFVLDMLALPPSEFHEALMTAFVDPKVIKLGFGFKQDLLHLQATFSGPETHGCFDKMEPYLDIGKIYRNLYANETSFVHRGRRIAGVGCNLSSVMESVLGLPLRKDMQCSNWEQRPLTRPQFDYAAADAYCLIAIFDALQVKAFEKWFSLSSVDDDEDVIGQAFECEVTGLQCLVSSEFLGNSNVSTVAHICHSKRGIASFMANVAMRENASTPTQRTSTSSHLNKATPATRMAVSTDALVRRFGEKLLLSEARLSLSKRTRKKPKGRGSRESRKGQQILRDKEDFPYVGPPPWDEVVGGNGIPKFLCDAMVEGLARQLRCVGIDAASLKSKKCEPREMVDMAEKEGRIILTRDVQLLRRRMIPAELAHRVTKQGKWDQLAEVIETFRLSIREDQLLSRCTKCNGHFFPRALSAEEAVAQRQSSQVIPDCALQNVGEFWQCSSCKHLYWQGTMFTRAYEQFVTVCQMASSNQKT